MPDTATYPEVDPIRQQAYEELRRRGVFKNDPVRAAAIQELIKRGALRDASGGSSYGQQSAGNGTPAQSSATPPIDPFWLGKATKLSTPPTPAVPSNQLAVPPGTVTGMKRGQPVAPAYSSDTARPWFDPTPSAPTPTSARAALLKAGALVPGGALDQLRNAGAVIPGITPDAGPMGSGNVENTPSFIARETKAPGANRSRVRATPLTGYHGDNPAFSGVLSPSLPQKDRANTAMLSMAGNTLGTVTGLGAGAIAGGAVEGLTAPALEALGNWAASEGAPAIAPWLLKAAGNSVNLAKILGSVYAGSKATEGTTQGLGAAMLDSDKSGKIRQFLAKEAEMKQQDPLGMALWENGSQILSGNPMSAALPERLMGAGIGYGGDVAMRALSGQGQNLGESAIPSLIGLLAPGSLGEFGEQLHESAAETGDYLSRSAAKKAGEVTPRVTDILNRITQGRQASSPLVNDNLVGRIAAARAGKPALFGGNATPADSAMPPVRPPVKGRAPATEPSSPPADPLAIYRNLPTFEEIEAAKNAPAQAPATPEAAQPVSVPQNAAPAPVETPVETPVAQQAAKQAAKAAPIPAPTPNENLPFEIESADGAAPYTRLIRNHEDLAAAFQDPALKLGYTPDEATKTAHFYEAIARGWADQQPEGTTSADWYKQILPGATAHAEQLADLYSKEFTKPTAKRPMDVTGRPAATYAANRYASDGSVIWDKASRNPVDLRRVLLTFTGANPSSPIHELGHVFLDNLSDPADNRVVNDWLGVPESGQRTDSQREQFAQGFERWTRDGKAPNASLKGVFQTFRNFMTSVYQRVTQIGGKSGVKIRAFSPEVIDVLKRNIGDVSDLTGEGVKSENDTNGNNQPGPARTGATGTGPEGTLAAVGTTDGRDSGVRAEQLGGGRTASSSRVASEVVPVATAERVRPAEPIRQPAAPTESKPSAVAVQEARTVERVEPSAPKLKSQYERDAEREGTSNPYYGVIKGSKHERLIAEAIATGKLRVTEQNSDNPQWSMDGYTGRSAREVFKTANSKREFKNQSTTDERRAEFDHILANRPSEKSRQLLLNSDRARELSSDESAVNAYLGRTTESDSPATAAKPETKTEPVESRPIPDVVNEVAAKMRAKGKPVTDETKTLIAKAVQLGRDRMVRGAEEVDGSKLLAYNSKTGIAKIRSASLPPGKDFTEKQAYINSHPAYFKDAGNDTKFPVYEVNVKTGQSNDPDSIGNLNGIKGARNIHGEIVRGDGINTQLRRAGVPVETRVVSKQFRRAQELIAREHGESQRPDLPSDILFQSAPKNEPLKDGEDPFESIPAAKPSTPKQQRPAPANSMEGTPFRRPSNPQAPPKPEPLPYQMGYEPPPGRVRALQQQAETIAKTAHIPDPTAKRVVDAVVETADSIRTAKVIGDLGYVGRQGAALGIYGLFDGTTFKAAPELVKSFGKNGEANSEAFYQSVASHPAIKEALENGLRLDGLTKRIYEARKQVDANAADVPYMERPENYASKLADKVGPLKAIETANTTYLDALRWNSYLKMKEAIDIALPGEKGAVERGQTMEAIARYVNMASGKGDLSRLPGMNKERAETLTKVLRVITLSPTYGASRLQMFGDPSFYAKQTPVARKLIAQRNLAYAGAVLSTMALAQLMGGKYENGKMRFGDVVVDMSAGLVRQAKTIYDITRYIVTGNPDKAMSTTLQYMRNGANPVAGYISDIFMPQYAPDRYDNPIAKKLAEPHSAAKVSFSDKAKLTAERTLQLAAPMVVMDLADIIRKDAEKHTDIRDPKTLAKNAAQTGMSVFGLSAQQYDKYQPKGKIDPALMQMLGMPKSDKSGMPSVKTMTGMK